MKRPEILLKGDIFNMFSAAAVGKLWQVQIELLKLLLLLLSQAAALQRNWNKKEEATLVAFLAATPTQNETRSYPSKCKYILYKVLSHLLTKSCFLPDVVAPLHFNQCLSSKT